MTTTPAPRSCGWVRSPITPCATAIGPAAALSTSYPHWTPRSRTAPASPSSSPPGCATYGESTLSASWSSAPRPLGIEPIDSDADELDVEVTPEQAIEYAVEATIDELQDFFVSLGMPRALSEFGVTEDDIEKMIPGLKINRGELFGSFRKLTLDNARKIYRSAL